MESKPEQSTPVPVPWARCLHEDISTNAEKRRFCWAVVIVNSAIRRFASSSTCFEKIIYSVINPISARFCESNKLDKSFSYFRLKAKRLLDFVQLEIDKYLYFNILLLVSRVIESPRDAHRTRATAQIDSYGPLRTLSNCKHYKLGFLV